MSMLAQRGAPAAAAAAASPDGNPIESHSAWQTLAPEDAKQATVVPAPALTYFTVHEYGGSLFLFGGFSDQSSCGNTVWTLRPSVDASWRRVDARGELPRQVYLHSAAVGVGKMWVFGGNSPRSVIHNDLHAYDFATQTWTKVQSTNVPPERHGHTAVATSTVMIVVGGRRMHNVYLNDTHEYNFSTNSWRQLGQAPLETAYHSLFTFDDEVYLYGGYNGVSCGDKLYKLVRDAWVEVVAKGPLPAARCGVASGVSGRYLYVFGGYSSREKHMDEFLRFDMLGHTWTMLQSTNTPVKRAYLQGAVCDGHFYVLGGFNGKSCVSDCRRVSVPTTAWTVFSNAAAGPAERADALLTRFGKQRSGWLSRTEVMALVGELGAGAAAGAAGAEDEYEFDTAMVPQAVAMGFRKNHVLQVLERLAREHKVVAGPDALVNLLVLTPEREGYSVRPKPRPAGPTGGAAAAAGPGVGAGAGAGGEQKADAAKIQRECDNLKEQIEQMLKCTLCFVEERTTALVPCGHIIGEDCFGGLPKRECPFCRATITSHLALKQLK